MGFLLLRTTAYASRATPRGRACIGCGTLNTEFCHRSVSQIAAHGITSLAIMDSKPATQLELKGLGRDFHYHIQLPSVTGYDSVTHFQLFYPIVHFHFVVL